MKKKKAGPITIHSITELHRVNGIAEPEHPLISLVRYEDIQDAKADFSQGLTMSFYLIAIKKEVKGKIRYGQNYYDFDEGVLSFVAPGQVCYAEENSGPYKGCMLMIHPDFLLGHSLAKEIKNFTFFSYAVNEALLLSKKEEKMVESIFKNIETEYRSNIDSFSQPVMISQIELLLNYANRFYNRQFITRKPVNHDLLTKLETLLDEHFNDESATGLPTVKDVAERLHVSADYLGDMLRAHTGQNTQQHIHNKLIEKAKTLLSSSMLTVAEVAYSLGFEHPQSFNKIFKKKTNLSPIEFRQSLN